MELRLRPLTSGGRLPISRPPLVAQDDGNGGGGGSFFYRRRNGRASFPTREPPAALVARGLRPLEPVLGGGWTAVPWPRWEDNGGLDLTEFLSVGLLGRHVDRDELLLGPQAPPPEELPAGNARLRRSFAISLGVAFAIAVAVERAEHGNGNGVAPRHYQLPGAAAVHAIPAASPPVTPAAATSSSPAPAAAAVHAIPTASPPVTPAAATSSSPPSTFAITFAFTIAFTRY